MTIQPWEVRAADDFEKVFAALSKERPDGLYVMGGSPRMIANRKRIAGLALKSRLPSMYQSREFVDAEGSRINSRVVNQAMIRENRVDDKT